MSDSNKQVCRLCLVITPSCECETIDNIKKEILHVLQINIDFDISDYAVACDGCLERLQDCVDFKSHITTLVDADSNVDIKNTSQREMTDENICLEKSQVCQLCMSSIEERTFNYTIDLEGGIRLKDMISNCLPEADLNIHVHEPLICQQCLNRLKSYYEFMNNCQKVEQKIQHFCQVVNRCTAGRINLEDVVKFKDYDMLGPPLIIKKECLDVQNDENIAKSLESEETASIKCEEIHIKDELDNRLGKSGSYQLNGYNNLEGDGSSEEKKKVGECEPNEKNYVCPKCPYSTTKICNFNKHINTHSNNTQHCCNLCSFVTDARLLLRVHMTSHKGATKKYGCGECPYETDHKQRLALHILKHKDISEVEMYKCAVCPFESRYKSKLVRHRKLQHDKTIKMYKCEKCSFITKYKKCLVTHHMLHEDPKVANRFKCEKCPFQTKWQGGLKKHMTRHFPEQSKHIYSCGQCTYFSAIKNNLLRHQLVHQGDEERQMYKCELCDYQAKHFRSVKVHTMKTHEDPSAVPVLRCTQCSYETAVKHHLSSHIRWRHGSKDQRPFKCELCAFGTWHRGHLKQHQLTHIELGEAIKYYCATCDFKTIYKQSLTSHIKHCMKRKRTKDTDEKEIK